MFVWCVFTVVTNMHWGWKLINSSLAQRYSYAPEDVITYAYNNIKFDLLSRDRTRILVT